MTGADTDTDPEWAGVFSRLNGPRTCPDDQHDREHIRTPRPGQNRCTVARMIIIEVRQTASGNVIYLYLTFEGVKFAFHALGGH